MLPTTLVASRATDKPHGTYCNLLITQCWREGHELGRFGHVVRLRPTPFPDYPVLPGIVYGSTITGQCILSPTTAAGTLTLSAPSVKIKSKTNPYVGPVPT
jgi:hypothetical protein